MTKKKEKVEPERPSEVAMRKTMTKKQTEKQKYDESEAALNLVIKTFKKQIPIWLNYHLPDMKKEGLEEEDIIEEVLSILREEMEAMG